MESAETKRIIMLDSSSSSQTTTLNERTQRRKKIAASNDAWTAIAEKYATQNSQLALLGAMSTSNDETRMLLNHLKAKQSGYKSQDVAKGWFNESQFVRIEDIVALLSTSRLSCFYCGCWTTLFYEYVRDSKQWSLERLSNEQGHNRDNVVLACLECNMRRRTMYYERYVATKQLRVNKMEPGEEDEEDPL
jgi:hypothetical protein